MLRQKGCESINISHLRPCRSVSGRSWPVHNATHACKSVLKLQIKRFKGLFCPSCNPRFEDLVNSALYFPGCRLSVWFLVQPRYTVTTVGCVVVIDCSCGSTVRWSLHISATMLQTFCVCDNAHRWAKGQPDQRQTTFNRNGLFSPPTFLENFTES